jgi:hypothetical protein
MQSLLDLTTILIALLLDPEGELDDPKPQIGPGFDPLS